MLATNPRSTDLSPKPRAARSPRVVRGLLAILATLVALLFALPASAGSLHTTDDADVLSSSDLGAIRKHVNDADFDVRLITTTSYASKSDLGNYIHRFVTEPNIVVIGVDPTHRHVTVHFGTGTRIADTEFKSVEQAGLSYFKESDWKGGVIAIVDRAEKAVGTGSSGGYTGSKGSYGGYTGTPAPSSHKSSGISFFSVLMWVVGFIFLISILGWIFGRRSSTTYVSGGYGGGGYGGPPAGYGGYGGPPPGPYYGGGGSSMGSNIASAGIGGLIGYEIGKEVGEHHRREYDGYGGYGQYGGGGGYAPQQQQFNGGGDSGQAGNYDAGGASGGWDDSSGGSSGGGDSGSGGSDF